MAASRSSNSLHVVWFKRDLRLEDHLPLTLALQDAQQSGGAVVLVYLIEPSLLKQKDSAPQHFQFALECLQSLAKTLPATCPLHVVESEAVGFFDALFANNIHSKNTLYSHQETGNWASFERDKQVATLLKANSVRWKQFQSNAVVRGPLDRNKWSNQWLEAMDGAPLPTPDWKSLGHAAQIFGLNLIQTSRYFTLDHSSQSVPNWCDWSGYFPSGQKDKNLRQKGGLAPALACLQSFLTDRGQDYRREMSSPLSAESSCSRISPYLTFGVLSIRQVLRMLDEARASLADRYQGANSEQLQKAWRMSYKSFESRLHWHCHFIQKLETEPELEFRAAHRALNNMRSPDPLNAMDLQKLKAWETGQTGYPMIDACMRMLRATGWVNFRMRAMLVAFASYQLWLDWRHTAPVLAREFLDYEPGIHYPQFQMQSGVTGINTLRIYNPVKQAQDQDPDGIFIRHWVPELKRVPLEYLACPWALPDLLAHTSGFKPGVDYPRPVVNPDSAISDARSKITAFRKQEGFAEEAKKVYQKHGSRNPNRNGVVKKASKTSGKTSSKAAAKASAVPQTTAPANQLSLFDE
ncbi:MAG: deoxyribodipyrimidine photo-lyase/cryptochrome family protein [Limnobacter sp.]|nr:deoxyribodipyrimidine photo-lyase/cryptochrome family protein [Limnobacter sp.]